MQWVYLGPSIVFEIGFALGANAAKGFTRVVPSILTLLCMTGAIVTLSLALRDLDIGVAYPIWTGIGAAGTFVIGAFLFHEPITWTKTLHFGLIVAGAMGLKRFGKASANSTKG
jgi:quaternary ammonium compound-resistance protein SugE